jgi:hypothetical protein
MSSIGLVRLQGAILAVALAVGTAASAATVQIQEFAQNNVVGAQAAHAGFVGAASVQGYKTETFASHQAWNGVTGTTNPAGTKVGSFSSLGGIGTGQSAINGGAGLEVRNDNPFRWGRHSILNPGGNWLDSNDTYGMRWQVGGLSQFNALSFFMTDVADVGGKFSLKVGDTVFSDLIGATGRLANGTIHFVTIFLPTAIDSLVVELRHDRLNDGFGIDGVTVAQVAPVPLPPAAALLIGGLVILVGLRRKAAMAA